jgi:hypothetical protein
MRSASRRRFRVRGESLEGSERTEALGRIAAISARIGAYQEKTDREVPIVRLTRETADSAIGVSVRVGSLDPL